MRKVKFRKLLGGPLMRRYRRANPEKREAMAPAIEQCKQTVTAKMESRGYQLEAIVSTFYGVFTRGPALGSVELVDRGTRPLPQA